MSEQIKLKNVNMTSSFWNRYRDLIPEEVLPYQWAVMNDEADINIAKEPGGPAIESKNSHAIANLKIAAGRENGEHFGYPFQDTDVYKWLEAAAYSLKYHDDADLKNITDKLIDLIGDAQSDDGYLVTYFQLKEPERKFKRLAQSHELYTMGHYIEAAVAYYQVTGNEKALDIAKKMADCIDNNFGLDQGQIAGVDGHPEIELALARLYEVTGDSAYLNLAKFFIDQRGQDSEFFFKQMVADGEDRDLIAGMHDFTARYFQAEGPIKDQDSLFGHAVRVAYLCTGIAHVARLTDDQDLLAACHRFWKNIVQKRMYVTGAIGSTNLGEAFTYDYDLPNDTMYGETCASVGMAFFAKEMREIEPKGEYGDVLEKEIFNGAIAGMSLDGKQFYYVNPLEADPIISKYNPSRAHVLTHRADWFGCACCPSNIARLIASIDQYIYYLQDDTIISDQFIANEAEFSNEIKVVQSNNYPWSGNIEYKINNPQNISFKFGIRIPSWTRGSFTIKINGQKKEISPIDGILYLDLQSSEVSIELDLDMKVRLVQANQKVRYDFGKVSVQRGPITYCTESADNKANLWEYQLKTDGNLSTNFDADLLDGVVTITADAGIDTANQDELYTDYAVPKLSDVKVKLIPYYAWANRENGQMTVWQNVLK